MQTLTNEPTLAPSIPTPNVSKICSARAGAMRVSPSIWTAHRERETSGRYDLCNPNGKCLHNSYLARSQEPTRSRDFQAGRPAWEAARDEKVFKNEQKQAE